jgi:hypothetical protein
MHSATAFFAENQSNGRPATIISSGVEAASNGNILQIMLFSSTLNLK